MNSQGNRNTRFFRPMYKIEVELKAPETSRKKCSRPTVPVRGRESDVNRIPKALEMFRSTVPTKLRQATALAITLLLCTLPANAGIRISSTQGLTMTGADGIYFDNVSGLTMTGADGVLPF